MVDLSRPGPSGRANPSAAKANDALAPRSKSRRLIVTPEGVEIEVHLAERGERAAAIMLDLFFLFGGITLFVLAAIFLFAQGVGGYFLGSTVLLVSFVVRSFYFIYFELRWQGKTPGKRLLGMRVVDRRGGPLTPSAVIARNLMREVELFLPMAALFLAPEGVFDALSSVGLAVWLGILVLLPCFNRDRLRAGDMVAGTWVVVDPKVELLPDLAAESTEGKAGRARQATPSAGAASSRSEDITFTDRHLGIYGILELQTLERVLRLEGPNAPSARQAVAERIKRKIGWTGARGEDPTVFLRAFYTALRTHLEKRMLFGKRREDQHDEN